MSPVQRALRRVRQPRVERIVFLCIYLLAAIGGLSALLHPPASIEGAIGYALTYTWGAFVTIGGLAGAAAVLPGRWWLERIAIKAGFTGASIYALVVGYLHITSPTGNRIPQFAAIAIIVLVCFLRGHSIRGLDYEPRPLGG